MNEVPTNSFIQCTSRSPKLRLKTWSCSCLPTAQCNAVWGCFLFICSRASVDSAYYSDQSGIKRLYSDISETNPSPRAQCCLFFFLKAALQSNPVSHHDTLLSIPAIRLYRPTLFSSSFWKNSFNGSLCLNNAELQALMLNLVWHLTADWLICISVSAFPIPSFHFV